MSKLKGVLEKRIAKIDERLVEIAESTGGERARLGLEAREIETLEVAFRRVESGFGGVLSSENVELATKYGVKTRLDCVNKLEAIERQAKELLGPQLEEKKQLVSAKNELQSVLPLLEKVEGALANYLPLAKEVSGELAPELAEVIMVLVELFGKTSIEVWGRAQAQFAGDMSMLWAKGLKIKLDALIDVGFSKTEAMQLLLANSTSPANALLQGLKNNSSRVNLKK